MNSNDNELLRQYVFARSESAFAELVRRHIDVVFSAAARLVNGDQHLAEDVTQAVFLGLARKASRLTGHTSVVGWLYTSTRYTAANLRRSEERRRTREQEILSMAELNDPTGTDAAWAEMLPAIDTAMQELKEEDREVVLLRYFERLPLATVGARLGVTENAARMRVERAIERLRHVLAKRGITSSVIALGTTLASRACTSAPEGLATRVCAAAAAGVGITSILSLLLAKWIGASGVAKAAAVTVLATAVVLPVWRHTHIGSGTEQARGSQIISPTNRDAIVAGSEAPVNPTDAPQAAASLPRARSANTINFRLIHKATQQPIADAPLRIKFGNWGNNDDGVLSVRTDSDGRYVIPLPDKTPPLVHVKVRKPGFGAMYVSWFSATNLGGLPSEYTLELEPGTAVGGMMLNERDEPVPGAKLDLQPNENVPRVREPVHVGSRRGQPWGDSVITDAQGRWYSDVMPNKLSDLSLRITAANYNRDRLKIAATDKLFPQLLSAEAVLRANHGVKLTGRITSQSGQPIAGAEVLQGPRDERDSVGIRTKADGQFEFAHTFMPGNVQITVTASNFSPIARMVEVSNGMSPMQIELEQGYTLRARVVDENNLAIAGASVSANMDERFGREKASTSANVEFRTKTDADGRFQWVNAPREDIKFDITKSGVITARAVVVKASEEEQLVRLDPKAPGNEARVATKLTIRGTVVDRDTGEPIPNFKLTPASPSVWISTTDRLRHTNHYWINDKAQTFSNGAFEITFTEPLVRGAERDGYFIRIDAEGHGPALSRHFMATEKTATFNVKLAKARGWSGMFRTPEGAPYADGILYLLNGAQAPQIVAGKPNDGGDSTLLKTDSTGRCFIPPQVGDFSILIAGDVGYARIWSSELAHSTEIVIPAWSVIEGKMVFGSTPATDAVLGIMAHPDEAGPMPRVFFNDSARPDERGIFRFAHVPPGKIQITQRIPRGANSWMNQPMKTVEVRAGEIANVDLGSEGQTVKGELVMPEEFKNLDVNEIEASVYPDLGHPPLPVTINSDAERDAWFNQWRESEVGKRHIESAQRRYPVKLQKDGSFEAHGIPPGAYRISFTLVESGDVRGSGSKRFQIQGGSGSPSLDLGTVSFRSRSKLSIGDVAPAFTVQTADGKSISLADFQGKFVLLDFWSTMLPSSVRELPLLGSIHDQYRADSRLVVISVNTEPDTARLREFVRHRKLDWLQTWNSEEPSAAIHDYLIRLPATFLISPDGKILARDIRGERTKEAVLGALGRAQ